MKRIFLIWLLSICLASCEQTNQSQQNTQNYSKFDLFVKRFKSQNSKMWTNDITKQEGNDKFKKQVLSFFNDSLGFSNIPLYVFSINKLGKGYVVHMQNNDNYQKNDISEFSHIDVFVLTNEDVARPLIQGDSVEYSITKYKKVNFLTDDMRRIVTADRVWDRDVDLIGPNDRTAIAGNSYGNYILEAKEIKKMQ